MRIPYGLTRATASLVTCGILLVPLSLSAMDVEDAPQAVTIDTMAKLYSPVEFDHELHAGYAACQECHHHTTGGPVSDPNCARCHGHSGESDVVSCSGCHEAARFHEEYLRTLESPKLYHIDKPGLKGAYHLNCISCHEVTSGPTGCQDCHAMTDAGERLFDTGKYSPAGTSGSGTGHH